MYRLAKLLRSAGAVQNVILNLKCHANAAADLFHFIQCGIIGSGQCRSYHQSTFQQCTCFQGINKFQHLLVQRLSCPFHINDLTSYHAVHSGFTAEDLKRLCCGGKIPCLVKAA